MHTPKQRRKLAAKAESRVAKDLGGKKVFNSGAGFEKSDVRVPGKLRSEVKHTSKNSYTFKIQDWIDLLLAALSYGEYPIFVIDIQGLRKLAVVTKRFAKETLEFGNVDTYEDQYTAKRSFSITPKRWNRAEALTPARLGLTMHYNASTAPYELVVLPYDVVVKRLKDVEL